MKDVNVCPNLVWGTPPFALNGGSGTDAVSGFVCLAVHTASQSDSSFVKRHEKITSLVWPDQSDSRFTAGSFSLIVCVCRHITTSAFQIDRSTAASVPDSNFPVESLATRLGPGFGLVSLRETSPNSGPNLFLKLSQGLFFYNAIHSN